MKPALKKTFSAIIIALASLVIVIGIASLAMVQDGTGILPRQDDATATPTLVIVVVTTEESGSGGSSDPAKPTETPESSIVEQIATPPSVISCDTPEGWMPIIVMPELTLEKLATQYKTSSETLRKGNCLVDNSLTAGTILFVPITASQNSQSSAPCGPPAGWVIYYVQPGDTLYGIATMVGTSVNQLINANCINSTYLYSGQRLWVPPYNVYPIQPIGTPVPTWITFPMLMTPQTPMLPTGIPFPIFPPTP